MVVVGTQTERQLREQVDQAEQQFEHHVTTRRRQRLAKDRKVQKRGEQGRDPKRVQRILNIKDRETQKSTIQRHWRCGSNAGVVGAMLVGGARQRRRDPSVPLPLLPRPSCKL